jgi:hypothetical protein
LLAALVSLPLSLSGLWIDRASASDPGYDSTVDFALDNPPGAVNNGYFLENQQVIPARSDFTVEVWVQPDTLSAKWNQIIHNRNADNYQRLDINVGAGTAESDRVQVIYGYGSGAPHALNLSPEGLTAPIGEWTHVAVSVSHLTPTSFKISLFRNGARVYEQTQTGAVFADLDNDFYVGYHPGFTAALGLANETRTFDGQIDQLKVWDAALDPAQISQSMHALGASGVTGTPTLRASYDFNEGTASTTAFDRVGSRDLAKVGTNSRVDVKQTNLLSGSRTVLTFPRTYLPGVGGWTVPEGVTLIDQLVVGGGGGGGSRHGGGGGAGALLYQQSTTVSGVLKVQVGQGGKGNVGITTHNGELGGGSGQSSFLDTTELKGGGGGAGGSDDAQAGGSGGGTGGPSAPPAQATGTGLFNLGGGGDGSIGGANYSGGGGGGAQSAGFDAIRPAAGAGGSGYVSNITGSLACYAAGGGGGSETNTAGTTGGNAGPGGACTSGQVTATVTTTAGAGSRGNAAALSAAPNSGSGGGGGGYQTTTMLSGESGFGGSGIVIVAYVPSLVAPSTPGTPSATAGNSSASLTWTPSETGTAPITYSVETIPPGGTCVVTGDGFGTTASCTGLTNGVSYQFRVTASNGPSSSSTSGTSTSVTPTAPAQPVVVPPVTEPPAAPEPSHVDLSGDGETLRIETTPEAPAGVTKYIIKLTPSGKSCEILSTTTYCDITAVKPGVEYKVLVIAANSLGQSEPRTLGKRVLLGPTGWLQFSGKASFDNFSGYSAQAKKAIKSKFNRFVRSQTSAVHFACTGFAVAPSASEPIIELATDRARVVCKGLKTKNVQATFEIKGRVQNVSTIGANRKVVVRAYSPFSK